VKRALIALLLLVPAAEDSSARTWYVKADRTGDVPTIQAAVDTSVAGDTVLVAPGTYGWTAQGTGTDYGMIFFGTREGGIVLRSEMGPQATILDGEYKGRIMFIQGWNDIVVEGFTFRRGKAPQYGGYIGAAITAHLSYDTVRNCVFRDNIADRGGALWCGGWSSMQIEDCLFFNNEAINGGAIFLINSTPTPTFRNCVIRNNRASGAGGALYAASNGFNLENCVLAGNTAELTGGAVYARAVYPSSILSCTIAENIAPEASGVYLLASPAVSLQRSIVAYGAGPAFGAANGSTLTVSCSDVFGNSSNAFPAGVVDAGGNFTADPLFCGARGTWVYSISAASSCAPGRHPDGAPCGLVGALGPACGSVRTQPVTWGHVKALYRAR
jgi:hypothetical protein